MKPRWWNLCCSFSRQSTDVAPRPRRPRSAREIESGNNNNNFLFLEDDHGDYVWLGPCFSFFVQGSPFVLLPLFPSLPLFFACRVWLRSPGSWPCMGMCELSLCGFWRMRRGQTEGERSGRKSPNPAVSDQWFCTFEHMYVLIQLIFMQITSMLL